MSSKEFCLNCGERTNTARTRLIKDNCGHEKCRLCLINDERGCKICLQTEENDANGNNKCNKPLELVVHKSSMHSEENPTDTKFIYTHSEPSENRDSVSNYSLHKKASFIDTRSANDSEYIVLVPGTPNKYKCNGCGKVFRNKKGKHYHRGCVTGRKPYNCTLCDKSFAKRSHFEYHERIHSGYRPFKCDLCDKSFPQRNKLNRHMFTHSGEKQFVCTECEKRFTKRENLKYHLTTHDKSDINVATYSCEICEKAFRALTALKRHHKTHTNERPYVCDQCEKSFKDNSLLIRHKRIHGKERPFSCADCARVFLSKSELRRHLTVHSDEKPFSCDFCGTVFRRRDNLRRHIRHHHPDTAASSDKIDNSSTVLPTNNKNGASNVQNVPKPVTKVQNSSNTTCKAQGSLSALAKSANLGKTVTKNQSSSKTAANSTGGKVSVVYISSCDQINSRLDSTGKITPVIRTTNEEISNKVSVINGPISAERKSADTKEPQARRKTFNYTEPIPVAEAVVINKRIEEKLYPNNGISHSYYLRNCLNCTEK